MATITPVGAPDNAADDIEKNAVSSHGVVGVSDDAKPEYDSDATSQRKQDGVKKFEAITTVWSSKILWVMFILLYLLTFVDMLLQSVQSNLTPYVTSAFSSHGLLATTGIVSSVLGGVFKLTIAKIIDIWGRIQGFLAMVLLITIGMIMKATCQNVETYAAAQTLFWVGHLGLIYIIDVVLSDMTTLKNRMIMLGLNGTPTIATTFAGPRIAELFYEYVNFRWAFGAFAIILVGFCVPVAVIFIANEKKAKALGQIPEKTQSRPWFEAFKYYLVEFDVIGLLLTTAGFSLLLLPFSLVYTAPNGWKSASIIAMLVIGVICLAVFVIWERFFAPVSYFPFKHLKDPTVLGACLCYGLMFTSVFCWDTYYNSYLQVVHEQSITHAGYILNAFSLASAFFSPFVGILLRFTGSFKWPTIAGAIPFSVLGTALLIHFRTPEADVGYLAMCQVFNGIAGAFFATGTQLAVMAAVSHNEIAVVLAILGLFGSVGAAIGMAIAGAIWTNVLPKALYDNLPDGSKNLTQEIYGSIVVQQSYPMGSPIRNAIIAAYDNVQRKMVIAGSVIIPILLICLLMWKNLNVKKIEDTRGKQTKGNVW